MRLLTKSLLTGALALSPFMALAADTAVSSVSIETTDTTLSATNDYAITFTTTSPIVVDQNMNVLFYDEDHALTTVVDLAAASYDPGTAAAYLEASDAILSDFSPFPGLTLDGASFRTTTELPAGTYTIYLRGTVNPSEAINLTIGITSTNGDQSDTSNYTFSEPYSIAAANDLETTSDGGDLQATNLRARNVKTTSALLDWALTQDVNATELGITYEVQLFKKSGDKIKTFKNLVTTKKAVTSDSGLLKAGKRYAFRVRMCADQDGEKTCSNWTDKKSFKMKSE